MLVFIDESGDPGMKRKDGSSRLFIVTAVIFEDNEEAQRCDVRINEIRGLLGVNHRFEFHFNKCCDRYRKVFLERVSDANFFYHAIVLNKAKLWGEGFKYKNSFYKYAASLVFENAKSQLLQAKVVVDKRGNQEFRTELAKYLKGRMNDGQKVLIKKVSMESSHSNNLLQLADMVSGAVFRSFDTSKANRKEFRKLLNTRELTVQVWPK